MSSQLNGIMETYITHLHRLHSQPQSTDELSLRPAITDFINTLSAALGYELLLLSEPARQEFGAPDFAVWRDYNLVGYIEAKPIGAELDRIIESNQFSTYVEALPNIVLSDHLNFILFNNGQRVDRITLCNPLTFMQSPTPNLDPARLAEFFQRFFQAQMPSISSTNELATTLADKSRLLHLCTLNRLNEEENNPSALWGMYQSYLRHLAPTFTKEQFSDMYAQSITYGLLMGVLNALTEEFTRDTCVRFIPRSVPLIRSLFQMTTGAGTDLPRQITWIIDDLCSLLNSSKHNIYNLLSSFAEDFSQDPLIPFYETFLSRYNPKERETRGVYYTPDPVVSFIIRSIDEVIKTTFDIEEGIGAKNVTLLDPAVGTGTFIVHAFTRVRRSLQEENMMGIFPQIVNERLLRSYFGFELLAAPYVIAHLKIARALEHLGITLGDEDRIGVYLTNTLLQQEVEQSNLLFLQQLSSEATKAEQIKRSIPILAIVGNPPYSGNSYNRGNFIDNLINDYKTFDGEILRERNPKWLNDDYVKFLRWSQWKILQSHSSIGVIGMITNNAYLNNPTFRIMRKNLLASFSEIYILNLHGNQRLKERTEDGSPDENVFDIRPGVCIALFVRKNETPSEHRIFYYDLMGSRTSKYNFLNENSKSTMQWIQLIPVAPDYLFKPYRISENYQSWLSIRDIMPTNSVAIVTGRDQIAVSFDRESLVSNLELLRNLQITDETIRERFELEDRSDWQLNRTRNMLNMGGIIPERIHRYWYRPFDTRFIYYDRVIITRPRHEVLDNLLIEGNIALIVGRSGRATNPLNWDLVFITDRLVDFNIFRRGGGTVFPLIIRRNGERLVNIHPSVLRSLNQRYGQEIIAEQILFYIYGVLNSPAYRERFAHELDIDFPRIPFTTDPQLFIQISTLGEQLAKLHLLHIDDIDTSSIGFPVSDSNVVNDVRFDASASILYVNESQYFNGITSDVYRYTIGDYNVVERWLKDRTGRQLMVADIQLLRRIIASIERILSVRTELDDMITQILSLDTINMQM